MTKGRQIVLQMLFDNKALILVILLAVFLSVMSPFFFTLNNMLNLIKQACVLSILGIGYTLLLSSGTMDLSVGNLMALTGVCMAIFDAKLGWPAPAVIIGGLAIGIGGLMLNTFLAELFKINNFILTLAMSMVYKGLLWVIAGGQAVSGISDWAKFLGQGKILGLPTQLFLLLGLFVFMTILLTRTKFGRHALAMGGNPKAANVCGINTKRIRYSIAIIMGVAVTMAALVTNGRSASAQLNAGVDSAMDTIAAVIIGGTPMSGGIANVPGTLIGSVLIQMIANALNLMDINSNWHQVAKGIIIIIAVVLDVQGTRIINKARVKSQSLS